MIPLLVLTAASWGAELDPYRRAFKHRPAAPPPTSAGPMPYWDIEHYGINVWLKPGIPAVTGTTRVVARASVENPSQIRLHARGPVVTAVTMAGEDLSFSQAEPFVTVSIPDGVPAGSVQEFMFTYTVTDFDDDWMGLNWGDPIHSFHEPRSARTWLVVYDDPADKATLHWEIRAPSELTVVANGVRGASVPMPYGTTQHTFAFDQPIATYLMALHAGTYDHHADTSGPVTVDTWAPPDLLDAAVEDFSTTGAIISHFESKLIPYPWTHYANVTAPFSGAMEHTTVTTFGEDLIGGPSAEIINAHEVMHHWFGNLVTLSDWSEIWLNEGLASYGEVLWVEQTLGEAAAKDYVQTQIGSYFAWQAIEGISSLHDPDYMWGGLVYDKGSVVVHVLRSVMGDDAFFDGLQRYLMANAHANASTGDLQQAMEESHGGDLGWFFDDWVFQAGDPSYRWGLTQREVEAGVWQADVHITQEAPGRWSIGIPMRIELASGESFDLSANSADGTQVTSFCLNSPVVDAEFDPHGQRLYFQALRLDGGFSAAPNACTEPSTEPGNDTGRLLDTGAQTTERTPDATGTDDNKQPEGCGCGTAPSSRLLWLALLPLAVILRRRA